ncbi:hypothetical protein MNBD_GAMMA11-2458 [hydrothermal vent metagenome]|uniref:DUF3108 domain-containing protein n=1 Tax=hydrothermal vent metagenome TaxID=652676 RepID=A0A3B0X3H4_9ZZZZ
MNTIIKILSSLLFSLLACNLFAATDFRLPPDHQSRYRVTAYGTHVGTLHNQLNTQKGEINYTSKATATGLASWIVGETVTETSILNWPNEQNTGIPQQKSYRFYRGKKYRKNQNMTFKQSDNATTLIEGRYKNRSYSLESQQLVWSRDLIPLLMSSDLQLNHHKTSGRFHITDKGNLNDYTYTLEKNEEISFNDKTFPTLKFMIKKQNSQRISYVWLSKAHYYLPLKIEQYKKGELKGSMQIKNITFTHKASKND